jgi:hypothetical protein
MDQPDKAPIKILHICPDLQGFYWIKKKSAVIRSVIALPEIIRLLKSQKFGLIISEAHNLYILDSPFK